MIKPMARVAQVMRREPGRIYPLGMSPRIVSLSVLCVVALAGCSSAAESPAPAASSVATTPSSAAEISPTPTPTAPLTATELAKQIKADVSTVTKIVTITEDNDPNKLLGRPNGYIDAAVIYDKGGDCRGSMGADCGATIEVWPTAADATARSEYIQKLLKDTPAFGTEYHTVSGAALLRVAGAVKPSTAKLYAAAFNG